MSTERIAVTRSQVADLDNLCHGIVTRDGQREVTYV